MARYSKKMSPKAEAYLSTIMGAVFAIVSVLIAVFFITQEAKKPDDVDYYKAKVTEIISVNSHYKTKSNSNGGKKKVLVYDSKVIVKYEVNGQEYGYVHNANDEKYPVQLGKVYYVEISPSNPGHVYSVSTTSNKFVNNMMKYMVAGLFFIVGTVFFISGIRKIKKNKSESNSNYNNMNDYDVNDYNSNSYNANDYNSNSYNMNNYGTGVGSSDYRGTSLDN